jgi:putative mRNA 3-end processing factor
MSLLEFTTSGIYCPEGDFYIDPWKPVARAVITHAHSDHARPGSAAYLCHRLTMPLLELRLGAGTYQAVEWNEPVMMNQVRVSLHPAGHIIGSSQVRVEFKGEVWVASGDYKTEDDGLSGAIEIVRCHAFITESTFGLPIYKWKTQEAIFYDVQNWIAANREQKKNSVLVAYSLGKAQRLLRGIAEVADPVFVHGAVWNVHQALVAAGVSLPEVRRVEPGMTKSDFREAVIIAPPSAESTPWMRRFSPVATGVCSGWMQVRGNVRRRNLDAGFSLSDHADWDGLLQVVRGTEAEKVFVTHGFQSAFSRYLTENGIPATEIKTAFGDETEEETERQLAASSSSENYSANE